MKLLKYIAVLPLAFSFVGIAEAQSEIFYTAPFHNVEVKAASKIYVEYGFSPHTQTLVCHADTANDAITSMEWIYKDATRKIGLPVTLKGDAKFKGYYADSVGKLVITNDFGATANNGSMFVSCDYIDMK